MPSEAAEATGSSAQAFQACRPLSRGLDHKAAPSPCPTPSASLSIVSSVSWLFMKTWAEKSSQEMIERSGVVGGQPVRNNLRHAAAHKGRGPGTPTAPGYHADRHLRRSLAASMLSRTTPASGPVASWCLMQSPGTPWPRQLTTSSGRLPQRASLPPWCLPALFQVTPWTSCPGYSLEPVPPTPCPGWLPSFQLPPSHLNVSAA